MFIPKNRVWVLIDAIDSAKAAIQFGKGDEELLNQIRDRAYLCQHGDANFLEVELCYANKPE